MTCHDPTAMLLSEMRTRIRLLGVIRRLLDSAFLLLLTGVVLAGALHLGTHLVLSCAAVACVVMVIDLLVCGERHRLGERVRYLRGEFQYAQPLRAGEGGGLPWLS